MADCYGLQIQCSSLSRRGRSNEKAPCKLPHKTPFRHRQFYSNKPFPSCTATGGAAMHCQLATCHCVGVVGAAMNKPRPFTPRQQRVINALRLKPCWREEVDRIAGASNSPQVISELRRRGFVIPCILVTKIDRDGKPCRPGRYYLQSEPPHG